ncbi:mandelate racemase/muconate lactonizing enzyme family protein [Paraburkholderia ginsengiterrae]|uniref:mandelate racemase/muconate lactonizing enzyme family protein n=1 Tax=Paraburkholderia ginsengiterrae TaxID=1462993 RepID=UPI001F61C158|nr:mandelate racemase/muconate lactonizing enzyme family protein [Paraburkholderia ginsengiterrae]
METVDSLIVKVTTDTGVVGWGESFGFTAIPAVKVVIDSILAPEMIGRDATQLEKRMLDLQKKFHVFGRSGAFIYGLSAIDIALWDIAGRVVGQPVHQLLGGSEAVSLPAYASLIRYSDPELVRENSDVRWIAAFGISSCMRSISTVSVRRAKRPGMTSRWPPENYSGLAQVRQQGGNPVAAGENASTLTDFQHLLEAGAVDFIQPSSAKMGGLTELRKVFALANAHNVTVMVHSFYDGPGPLANVHASAALGGPGAMVEWRYFDREAQLYGEAIIPKNGTMAVP